MDRRDFLKKAGLIGLLPAFAVVTNIPQPGQAKEQLAKVNTLFCPPGPWLDAAVEAARGRPGTFWSYVYINGQRHDVLTWIPDSYTPEDPPAGSRAGQMPRPYSTSVFLAKRDLCSHRWFTACAATLDAREHYYLITIRHREGSWGYKYVFGHTLPLVMVKAFLISRGVEEVNVPWSELEVAQSNRT